MERTLPVPRLGRLSAPGPVRAAGRWLLALAALLRCGTVALIAGGRRHPRWVAALLGVVAVLGLAYLGVRHSPLSRVRRVEVHGVSGMEAQQIEAALVAAAKRQSTLGVDVGALQAAVARYHLVSGLHVHASFPHTLLIVATEQLPVATLRQGSDRAVVASDGAVLDPSVAAGATPTINVQLLPDGRVGDPQLLSELTILGAASPAMLHRVARIYRSPNGITVSMRNGLLIFFGDAARPHAKWIAAARVIASPLAAGATYVDVRMPEDPAAGGLASSVASGDSALGTDATDASIAAALTSAMGDGTSAPPSSATPATTGAATTGAATNPASTVAPGTANATPATTNETPATTGAPTTPTTAAGTGTAATAPTTTTPTGGAATDVSPSYTSTGG